MNYKRHIGDHVKVIPLNSNSQSIQGVITIIDKDSLYLDNGNGSLTKVCLKRNFVGLSDQSKLNMLKGKVAGLAGLSDKLLMEVVEASEDWY